MTTFIDPIVADGPCTCLRSTPSLVDSARCMICQKALISVEPVGDDAFLFQPLPEAPRRPVFAIVLLEITALLVAGGYGYWLGHLAP